MVTGENDAPVAVADAVETNEDTAVVFDVHTNDVDVDGDSLSVAAINGTDVMAGGGQAIAVTDGGTLTLNADGRLSFNPNGEFEDLAPGERREVTATYQITDGRGGTDDGTVTIMVTGENDAPVAEDDAVETNEDTEVVFDVHTNDTDVDGGILFVAAINGTDVMAGDGQAIAVTDGGTLTLNADGFLSFNPNGEFEDLAPDDIREVTATYQITDGRGGTDDGTVTIMVTGENDAPVAVDDAVETNEDTAVVFDVHTNDVDVDGDSLFVAAINGTDVIAGDGQAIAVTDGGTLTLNADGFLSFNPNGEFEDLAPDDIREVTATYQITDGRDGTDEGTVTITVTGENDAPVAVADAVETNEDTEVVFAVHTNDTDVDGDSLFVAAINGTDVMAGDGQAIAVAGGGTLTLNADGFLSFNPNGEFEDLAPDDSREVTATYQITDGRGGTDDGTVTIMVTGENDAPVAVADAVETNEDMEVVFAVHTNDTDVDGGILFVAAINGTAVMAGGGQAIAVAGGGTLTLNADGRLSFNPNGEFEDLAPDDIREVTATYQITDGRGGTDDGTVTITVTGENDAPVAVDDAVETNEDTAVVFDVHTNDTDVDGDSLFVAAINGTAVIVGDGQAIAVTDGGTLTLNADGFLSFNPNGEFEDLAPGERREVTATYQITDGRGGTDDGTVTIMVTGENDAPVAVADEITVAEGGTATTLADGETSVRANDSDAETATDDLTVSVRDAPANGALTLNADGTFSYTHNGSETSRDSFTYTVTDEDSTTSAPATVTITVTPENDAPVAVGDEITVAEGGTATTLADGETSVRANDSDAETATDDLTVSVRDAPANGALTLNADGTFSYTHNGSETSRDSFTYTVTDEDSTTSAPATVMITVTPENDAPVAVADEITVAEGGTATTLADGETSVRANDSDAETATDDLTVSVRDVPANGALTLNADGTFSYTHNGSETSSDSFTYTVTDEDSTTSAPATVTITVTPENDAPVAVADAITVAEGGTATTLADGETSVRANDSDAETATDDLTVSVRDAPANGTLTLNADGTFSYTHNGSETSSDSFTYTVTDEDSTTSAPATVTIMVTPENDAPVAVDDAVETNEDTAVVFDVHTNDVDVDGDSLFVSAINGTAVMVGDGQAIAVTGGGTLTLNADGFLSFNPNGEFEDLAPDDIREVTATYQITDGRGGTDDGTVTITVTGENEAPVAVDDAFTVAEGGTATTLMGGIITSVTANDSDVETPTDELTARVAIEPAHGTLTLNPNGTFIYAHDGSETTEDSFTYIANDGDLDSAPATVRITITPENDAPVADAGFPQTVDEGVTVTLDGTGSSDPEEGPLTYQWELTGGSGITLNDATAARPTFTAPTGLSADESFVFQLTVTDDEGESSPPDTVTITVRGVDDPPVFDLPGYVFLLEENQVGDPPFAVGTVTATDPDVLDTPVYTILNNTEGLFSVDAASGVFSYIGPGENFEAFFQETRGLPSYILGVTATSGGQSVPVAVNVRVINVNEPPMFINLPYEYMLAEQTSGNPPMVLGTVAATDPDAAVDPDNEVMLTYSIATPTTRYTIDANSGEITFTGPSEDHETQPVRTLMVRVTDNEGATATATVTVDITNVDEGPVFDQFFYPFNLAENQVGSPPFGLGTVTATDPDVGDVIIYAIDIGDMERFSIDEASGAFSYIGPGEDHEAQGGPPVYTIVVSATSGARIITAAVVVTVTNVNDPPVAVADVFTVAEGGTATTLTDGALSVLDNDSDAETAANALTVRVDTVPANGALTLNPDGTFSYTHNDSETSSDSFTYIANDGDLDSAPATVTITVTPENDAPVAVDDAVETNEDTAVVFDVHTNDVDVDGDSLLVAAINGTAVMADDGQAIAVTGGGTLTLNADGFLSFNPNGEFEDLAPGERSEVTATYQITDGRGGTDDGTVTITVTGENDAPVAVADAITVAEGGTATTLTGGALSVLENDSDVDTAAGSLRVRVDNVPAHGTLTLNPDGTFSYNHNGDEEDSDSFTYIANDGADDSAPATVTIMVTPENDAPVAVDDAVETNEDTEVVFAVHTNDTDVDGDSLFVAAINGTAVMAGDGQAIAVTGGGTLTLNADGFLSFNPNGEFEDLAPDDSREVTVTYQITDGRGGTDDGTVTITVTGENDAPVAEDDAITVAEGGTATTLTGGALSVLDNDSDVDTAAGSLRVTLMATPTNGTLTLNENGTFSYAHNGSETSSDSFTYTVNDGALDSAPATVTITVTAENDAPVAVDDTITVAEGGTATTLADGETSVRANDSDAETATGSLMVRMDSVPSNGALTLNADGTFSYTHNGSETDSDSFTYIVNDGALDSAPATVTITVTPENDAPVAVADTITVAEGGTATTLTGGATSVRANDSDAETATNALTVMVDTGPANGALTLNTDGTFSYTHDGSEASSDSFTYTVNDGALDSAPATVTITVTPENDAPVAVDDAVETNEDTAVVFDVHTNDVDVDGDSLFVAAINGTAVMAGDGQAIAVTDGGTLTLNADGFLSFNPNGEFEDLAPDDIREVTATYQITDGRGGTDDGTVTITVTGENDAPVAVADAITVAEGGTATTLTGGALSVRANDSDVDTATAELTVRMATGPTNGTLTLNENGTFSYAHNGSETSSDSFTYIVNDGADDSAPATVTITVTPENDAPVAVDDTITVAEGGTATMLTGGELSVRANDSDAETATNALTVRVDTDPTNGALTLNADGTFSYTHNGSETSSDSFTYIVNDGALDSAPAMVTITVTPENDAPVAVADTITVAEGGTATTLTGGATSVRANDSDAETATNALTVMVDTGPANGALTLNTDGTFSYTHDGSEASSDSFTYTVNDGDLDSAPATVAITVTPENDAPVAVDDAVETNEDTAVVFDVHTNDVDVDGDSLFVAAINGTAVMAGDGQAIAVTGGGTLTLNADGFLSFNPNGEFEDLAPDDSREVTVTYQITDGRGGTDDGTVTITVTGENDAPVAEDDAITVAEGGTATTLTGGALSVLDNDSDVDTAAGSLRVTLMATPTNGTLTLNENGTFSYAHNGSETSSDSFTYTVNDGALDSAPATVTITVTAENDAPVAVDDTITVAEGGTATTLADGETSVRANDSDAETATGSLMVRMDSVPSNGALTLNADGTFSYTHNGSETDSDSFTYIVNDGALDSAPATVTITVTPENDAPVAVADTITVAEGGTATTLTGGATSVRANDSDAETATNALTVMVDTGPANGALTLNTDGTFSYTHDGSEASSDSFTYTVNDGALDSAPATVAITVTPENDAPVAVDDAVETNEDTAVVFDVHTNDVDVDGDSLFVAAINGTAVMVGDGQAIAVTGGGTLTLNVDGFLSFNPNGEFEDLAPDDIREVTATYQITDGRGGTDDGTVTITVTGENDAPVAVADAITVAEGGTATTLTGGALSVRANDSDVDTAAGSLRVTLMATPTNGTLTLNENGTFSYAHNGSETSSDSFTYTVNDGALDSAPATVTITVTAENDAPVAVDDTITVAEGGTATTLADGETSVRANDSDAETATGSLMVRMDSVPSNGALTLNADGTFSYTHNGSETDSDSFTYIVNDGALDSAPATVTITVTPENDAPVAVADTITVAEGGTATTLTGGATSVRANDSDAETATNALTVMVDTGPANGTLTLNADGTFSYTHDGSEASSDSFTYTVNDGALDSAPATVTITVTPENDAPVAVDDAVETNEDTAVVFDVHTNDVDVDGDSLLVAAINGTAVMVGDGQAIAVTGGGTLTLNADGRLSFNPNGEFEDLAPDDIREVTATYQITDGRGGTDDGTVTITVTGENDAPVAVDDAITVAEGGTATTLTGGALSVRDNDSDVDTPTAELTVRMATAPTNGMLTLNENGTFSYAHNGSETSSDSFTYIVNDGADDSAPATVTITVTPENDAPVAVDDTITVAEGGTATTLADGETSVRANDSDAETATNALTVMVDTGPAHGTLDLNEDGTFSYTHDGSETSSDSFTYTVTDEDSTTSAPATVTITVTPENDAPVAVDDDVETNEDTAVVFDVHSNDVDVDGDSLLVAAINGTAVMAGDGQAIAVTGGGTLSLNADGFLSFNPNGEFEDLAPGERREVTATYQITDGRGGTDDGTVTITVTGENDAPVAVADAVETNEDTAVVFDVHSNDVDVDGGSLSVAAINGTAVMAGDGQAIAVTDGGTLTLNADGRLSFNPNGEFEDLAPGERREVTATYQITDGRGGTDDGTVTITVTGENDAPVAVDDAITVAEGGTATTLTGGALSVRDNDSDVDTPTAELTVRMATAPTNGMLTLNENGTFSYAHNGSETSSDSFTYIVNDGADDSAPATVTITVTPENDAPVAVDDTITVAEGGTATTLADGETSVRANDSDAETATNALTVMVDTGPAHGTLDLNEDGTFSYTHDGSETSSDSFTYTVTDEDSTTSAPATVTITVTPENDAPVAVDDDVETNEDTAVVFDVHSNDVDVDGDSLLVAAINGTAVMAGDGQAIAVTGGGTLSLNADGFLSFNPNGEFEDLAPGERREVTATYQITDGRGGTDDGTVTITVTGENDAPVAVADAVETNEDTAVVFDVHSNDVDVDGGSLSVAAINGTAVMAGDGQAIAVTDGGTLTLNADGRLSFNPNGEFEDLAPGERREVTATYQITDGRGGTDDGTVTITVTGENDAPVAVDDAITVAEGGTATTLTGGALSVRDNDSDVDTPTAELTVRMATAPTNGMLTLNENGTFSYAHNGSETSSDSFTYIVNDGADDSAPATVTITVTPENDAPVAVDDTITVAEGGTATTLADGETSVRANDSDAETATNALTVMVDTGPAHGTLDLNEDGTFSYTHDGSETSSDSFTYTVTDEDSTTSAPATVTITVTPENDAPVAVDDDVETNEDTAVVFDVHSNDVDVDGDSLLVAAINGTAVMAGDGQAIAVTGGGTLSLNADGFLSFNPNGEFEDLAPGERREVTATYQITDGRGGTDDGTVTITVTGENDAPVAVADAVETNEDTAVVFDVHSNDVDVDGGSLSVAAINGTAVMAGDGQAIAVTDGGTLTLNADGRLSFNPNGEFEDLAPGERREVTATYQITDGRGGTDDGTVTITVTGENDAPVAVDDAITVAEGGTATTLTGGALSVRDNDSDVDTPTAELTVRMATAPTNGMLTLNENGTFSYAHNGSETSSDSFTYIVNDGADDSAPATVTITVTPENDAPVAVDDTITVAEGGTATTLADGETSVRANDSDAETATNALTVMVDTGPAHGTLDLNEDGTFSYTHDGSETSSDSFTYIANDGADDSAPATVTITVTPENDAPVAVDDDVETNEDTAVVFDVHSNDVDVDGDSLFVAAINGTAVMVGDGQAIAVTDGGTLTLNADGFLSFNPNGEFEDLAPDDSREVTATYQITDGRGGTDEGTVTIMVTGENDAPVAEDDAITVAEGGTATMLTGGALSVLENDSDVDTAAGSLRVRVDSVPAHGTLTLNPDGSFSYNHNGDEEDSDSFTYIANDGVDDSVPATVTIMVTPENDAPVAVDDAVETNEDTEVVFAVHTNDTDVDGDSLLVAAINGTAVMAGDGQAIAVTGGGTLSLNADGRLSFNPNGAFEDLATGDSREVTATYQITDGRGGTDDGTVTITVTGENDAPVAEDDAITVAEGGTATMLTGGALSVLENDSDVDTAAGSLRVRVDSVPAHGTLTLNPDGSFSYNHNGDEEDSDSFSYIANDGADDSVPATVTIMVTPENDAPVAVDDAVETNEDTEVVFAVHTNDTDVDGDSLLVAAINGTAVIAGDGQAIAVTGGGTLSLNADGRLSFNPNGAFEDLATGDSREVTATYQITDSRGGTDDGTVTITVTGENDAPVAEDDAITVAEGGTATTLTGGATSVLDNDSDVDTAAGSLTVRMDSVPAHGTLTLNPDGSFSYNHNGDEEDSDSFSYIANDGADDSVPATVTIMVTPENDAPVAVDDAVETNEDTEVVFAVHTNDTDVDGDSLLVAAINGTAVMAGDGQAIAVAGGGTLSLNADGRLSFNPNGAFEDLATGDSREVTATYQITDSRGGTDDGTVTIMVTGENDAPVAEDDAITVAEGGTATTLTGGATSVLDNDSDVDTAAGSLTVRMDSVPAHGTLTLNPDGSFSYNHNGDEEDSDSFTYIANDGADDSAPATVTIMVTPENDAPVAVDDAVETNEDTEVVFAVHTNDTDVDGDSLSVAAINGTDVMAGDGQAIAVAGGGTLTLNADGRLSFNPNGEFEDLAPGDSREVTATYQITDGRGGTDDGTVTIMVTGENDAPVAEDDAITVAEGGTATTLTGGATSVLDNDSDAETATGSLTVSVRDTPANGTLTLNADGTFSYTHDGSEASSDSFTYIANDGALDSAPATVAITVTPENDAPVAVDDDVETNEDTAVVFDVHTNDVDVDGDSLFVAAINGTAVIAGDGQAIAVTGGGTLTLNADGSLSFNPNGEFEDLAPGERREVTATYQITDDRGGTDEGTVTITVTGENDAPVAVADAITVAEGGTATTLTGGALSVRDNDSDVETPTAELTVRMATAPTNGTLTLNENGTFSYAHNGSETSSDSFTYIANDGADDSAPATVTITVTPENDAPMAVADAITVAEGGTATTLADGETSVRANDSDAETATGSLTVRMDSVPANGALTLNADGTFSYTHDGSETDSDSFTYIVNDGALDSAPATVTITVTAENDAPVAVADTITVAEGGTATTLTDGTTTSVRDNDSDAETATDDLTVSVRDTPTNGALTLNADGTFSYVHDGSETSSDSFTYTVTDEGSTTSAPATVTITVTAENDAPVAVADTITVIEGGTATTLTDGTTTSVRDNDSDAETATDALTVSMRDAPTNGTLTLNADGTFSYTHDGSETDSDSFTYIVNDGALDSAPATVTITVTPDNDAPVAVADAITVTEGGTATALADGTTTSVRDNDSDAETATDDLAVSVRDAPANGALTLNADGTFSYVHDGSETSSDSFTYTVTDEGSTTSAPATVTITVTAENDAPVAVADTITVAEGGTATTLTDGTTTSVRDNDSDAETATGSLTVSVRDVPANGTLTLNADGTFSYTHDGSETDSDSFTYIVNDGALDSVPATVTITVTAENDAPVAVADTITVIEGGTATTLTDGTTTSVRDNDSDAETATDDLTVSVLDAPANGTLTLNADGTFSYAHDGSETDSDSFTYTVTDEGGTTSAPATVTITVTADNDAPVAVDDAITVAEGGTATTLTDGTTTSVRDNDSDAETATDDLTVSVRDAPANGTLTLNADGTFSYTHDGSETSSDSFTYTVTDEGSTTSAPATVTITVTPENDAPVVINPGPQSYVQNVPITPLTITVNDDDGDAAGNPPTVTLMNLPDGLLFDGTEVTGTPTGLGDTVVTITAADGVNDRVTATFTITVTESVALSFGGATIPAQTYTANIAITDLTLPVVTGGTGPYGYALLGMPSGLSFDAVTRVLSGTPDREQGATSYTYTATDSALAPAAVTLSLVVTVEPGLEVTGGPLEGARSEAMEMALGAFGRSFASGAVDVLDERFTSGAGGSQLTLGGRTVSLESLTNGQAAANAGAGADNQPVSAAAGGHQTSVGALFADSAFQLSLNDGDDAGVGATTLWARGAVGNYEGEPEDDFQLDGDIVSGYLGLDYRPSRRTLVGVAVSHSRGAADFSSAEIADGEVETELTSILPYVQWKPHAGLSLWGLAGYGLGESEITDSGESTKTDVEMQMAALGTRGKLWSGGRADVALKASALTVEIKSDGGQNLSSVTSSVQRLRMALEGKRHGVASARGGRFGQRFELGLRWDLGDVETGAGADLGAGFEYANPRSGTRLRLDGNYLLVHEETDFEEWKVSAEIGIAPSLWGRGVTFALQPGWDSAGARQRMVIDFTDVFGPALRGDGLKLELYGEHAEEHEFGLEGSFSY